MLAFLSNSALTTLFCIAFVDVLDNALSTVADSGILGVLI